MTGHLCNVSAMYCLSRKQWFSVAVILVIVELLIILYSEIKLHFWPANGTPIEKLNGYVDDAPAELFLQMYRTYCDEYLFPQMSNVPVKFLPAYNSSLCSCVPDTLGK